MQVSPRLDTHDAHVAWTLLRQGLVHLVHGDARRWRPHIRSIVTALQRDFRHHPLLNLLIFAVWLSGYSHLHEADVLVLLTTTHAAFFSDIIFATPIDWKLIDGVAANARHECHKRKRGEQ